MKPIDEYTVRDAILKTDGESLVDAGGVPGVVIQVLLICAAVALPLIAGWEMRSVAGG